MHSELKPFLQKLKEEGLKVRLETNGSNPQFLEELIDNKLIDSVALDIKNSKEKYINEIRILAKIRGDCD